MDNLVAQLTRLPGIGTRTAQRLAFHILAAPADEANAIGHAIADVKARVRACPECGNLTEEELCGVCSDPRRDRTVICVVEQPVDVLSLERTHEYRGLYHVLGGALSPLDGVEPGDLRIQRLMDRVGADGVEEVVLADEPDDDGRGDRRLSRRPPARPGDRHAARQRPPGRRRPRVRRRGNAGPRAGRPPARLTTDRRDSGWTGHCLC